jgi:hypothetical protein
MPMTKSLLDYEADIKFNACAQVEFRRNDGDKITALPWTRDQLTPQEYRQWVASRKEAGREIDIETCEVDAWYAIDFDPYGADPDLPIEYQIIGKNRFVRSPRSRGWVHEDNLPDATRRALYERCDREAAHWAVARAKTLFDAIVSRLLELNTDMDEVSARQSATELTNNPSASRNSVEPELARLLDDHSVAQHLSELLNKVAAASMQTP